jgi:Protein of unknown function (DUF3667)
LSLPILVKIFALSHLKERKEKICLNCQSALLGRYCHVCGQENLEPKETVWHLIQHFFNDITHFDGKFFESVKFLLRRPGFLSKEYMLGRRAAYLNPIRMYVFTSAIFFIIFFSLQSTDKVVNIKETPEVKKSLPTLIKDRAKLQVAMEKETDSDDKEDFRNSLETRDAEISMIKKDYGDTTTRTFSKSDRTLLLAEAINDSLHDSGIPPAVRDKIKEKIRGQRDDQSSNFFDLHQERYASVHQYDSVQKALPDSARDGWFKHAMTERVVAITEVYHRDKKSWQEHLKENFVHSFPKILFWSLPFFALILNLLYFRHKNYYYVDHGIFTIHLYCANFILLLVIVLLNKLSDMVGWQWLKIVNGFLIFGICVYMLIYLYKAMRGFYQQRRAKTFLKYFLACLLAFIVNLIILLVFLLISVVTIH